MVSNAARTFRAEMVKAPREAKPFELPPHLSPQAPVDLEIGCGVGWHPIRYAQENPQRCLVAIERTAAKYTRFSQRLARHAVIPNLLAVHADAIGWTTHCLGEQKLSRVFLLYPNPEPKNPAQRWFRMPFMTELVSRLAAEGEIILASNVESYCEEARRQAPAFGLKEGRFEVFERSRLPASGPRTHFEKKYLERGEKCFEIQFLRAL
jgi:tRNA (guanine-N7-)-methyltransferase